MIDTDKYEGHTPAPWHIENEKNNGMRVFICSKGGQAFSIDATILWQCETTHSDALLVADAPLLLEEVKRLRQGIIEVMVKSGHYDTSEDWIKALGEVIE